LAKFLDAFGLFREIEMARHEFANFNSCCKILTNAGYRWPKDNYINPGVMRRRAEIDPHGLEEHQGPVQILDVREAEEFTGPLGHNPEGGADPVGRACRARW
jgi:hypothetical protein